jgi:hypothetical protein
MSICKPRERGECGWLGSRSPRRPSPQLSRIRAERGGCLSAESNEGAQNSVGEFCASSQIPEGNNSLRPL